jgi:hypothetical protein
MSQSLSSDSQYLGHCWLQYNVFPVSQSLLICCSIHVSGPWQAFASLGPAHTFSEASQIAGHVAGHGAALIPTSEGVSHVSAIGQSLLSKLSLQ